MKHEYWYERMALIRVRDRDYGELLVQGLLAKMSATPAILKWTCRPVGADNEFIYREFLGIDQEELNILKKEGVV